MSLIPVGMKGTMLAVARMKWMEIGMSRKHHQATRHPTAHSSFDNVLTPTMPWIQQKPLSCRQDLKLLSSGVIYTLKHETFHTAAADKPSTWQCVHAHAAMPCLLQHIYIRCTSRATAARSGLASVMALQEGNLAIGIAVAIKHPRAVRRAWREHWQDYNNASSGDVPGQYLQSRRCPQS